MNYVPKAAPEQERNLHRKSPPSPEPGVLPPTCISWHLAFPAHTFLCFGTWYSGVCRKALSLFCQELTFFRLSPLRWRLPHHQLPRQRHRPQHTCWTGECGRLASIPHLVPLKKWLPRRCMTTDKKLEIRGATLRMERDTLLMVCDRQLCVCTEQLIGRTLK